MRVLSEWSAKTDLMLSAWGFDGADEQRGVHFESPMPRTTLTIGDEALAVAKAHASRHGMTLGEAVSELVRQAAERPLVTDSRNGLQVVRLGGRSSRVTAALVDKLNDHLP